MKAVVVAVIFWVLSQHKVYDLTNKILPIPTLDASGTPSQYGILIHAIVAGLLMIVLCWLKARYTGYSL